MNEDGQRVNEFGQPLPCCWSSIRKGQAEGRLFGYEQGLIDGRAQLEAELRAADDIRLVHGNDGANIGAPRRDHTEWGEPIMEGRSETQYDMVRLGLRG